MSNAALDWAFALPLRQPWKGVVLALANRANKTGQAWPSRTLIALEAGVDVRTVIRATRRLSALGLIEIEASPGNRVNRYFLRVGEQCHAAVDGDRGSPSNRASTVTVGHRGDGDSQSPDGDCGTATVTASHPDGDSQSPEPKRTQIKATQRNPGGAGGEIRTGPKRRSRRNLPAAPPKGAPGLVNDGLRDIPAGLNREAFNEWDAWRQRRGGRSRASWTAAAQVKTAELLSRFSQEEQRAAVDASIAAGWTGLFPGKPSRKFDAASYILDRVRKSYERND